MNLARPIHPYLKQPNEVQIQCVVSRRVFTVDDFWLDVSPWKARKNGYVMQGLLYKKDIINFLRIFYCRVELDFQGMQKDGVISLHGQRPEEHFFLIPPYENHATSYQIPYPMPLDVHSPMPLPVHNRMPLPVHNPILFSVDATPQQNFYSTSNPGTNF